MSENKIYDFLSEVYTQLKQSEDVYKKYLTDGKKFLYAKKLKNHNLKIKDLLKINGSLLSENLYKDSSLLIAHYNSWLEKWDELEQKLKPKPSDEFVFTNSHTFPKQACKSIENEYLKLIEEQST